MSSLPFKCALIPDEPEFSISQSWAVLDGVNDELGL